MLTLGLILLIAAADDANTRFDSKRYGLAVSLPASWTVTARERAELVFRATVPQADPTQPGTLWCDLAIAPESLEDWRTRIDAQAKNGRLDGLTRNELVKTKAGERLETLVERRLGPDELWVEHTSRISANRQLYSFTLRVDSETYARVRTQFEALTNSAVFSPPETGTSLLNPTKNRWQQTEFKLAIDLPEKWQPLLAPHDAALLYASGPANGIWSDNCLVIARPHTDLPLDELERALPDRVKREDPTCEILQCKQVPQGASTALETVVRTKRGPFSMTVIERRFRGDRFDYEVKYTLESERFEALAPKLRATLDSFEELPGIVPGAGKSA